MKDVRKIIEDWLENRMWHLIPQETRQKAEQLLQQGVAEIDLKGLIIVLHHFVTEPVETRYGTDIVAQRKAVK